MQIRLEDNAVAVQVCYGDRDKIKALGFSWNPVTKLWTNFNADKLTAIQLFFIFQLEERFRQDRKERENFNLDLIECDDTWGDR